MKFIFGVVVGSAVGPRLYKLADKHYGHILVPYLQDVLRKIQDWKPPTGGSR